MPYQEALEYLTEVKVCSRYDLSKHFKSPTVRRLLQDERTGFVDLATRRSPGGPGSPKYTPTDLFDVSQPFKTKLFIIFLNDENDALIRYLADLIKPPGSPKIVS